MYKIDTEVLSFFKKTRQLYKTKVILWNGKNGIGWETAEQPFEKLTKTSADLLLLQTLKNLAKFLKTHVKIHLTKNKFIAILSLLYDIGKTSFKYSVVLECLNKEDTIGVIKQFRTWEKHYGKLVPKLKERRLVEIQLFLK